MKPENLLNQLSDLEDSLNNFSFEELTATEAKRLKTSFDSFKEQLETKIFGPEPESTFSEETKNGNPSNIEESEALVSEPIVTDPENGKIDLNPALEDCMGDISVLRELIRLYHQNALEFIGKVKIGLEQEDLTEIRNAAHKIKCGLAMMHTHRLHFIVEQMHNNCRTTRDIEHLHRLYECFVKRYLVVAKAMQTEMKRLETS